MTLNLEICRTCLKVCIDEKFFNMNEVEPFHRMTYKSMLKICIPEMLFVDAEEGVICNTCFRSLDNSFAFRGMCLETEDKLRKAYAAKQVLDKNASLIDTKLLFADSNIDIVKTEISECEAVDKNFMEIEIENSMEMSFNMQKVLNTVHQPQKNMNTDTVSSSKITAVASLDSNETEVQTKQKYRASSQALNQKQLSDKDILQKACKTLPELKNCSPNALSCVVDLFLDALPLEPREQAAFKCEVCRKMVKNKKHDCKPREESFQCHICFKVYTNEYVVKRHLREVHERTKKVVYKCKVCKKMVMGKKHNCKPRKKSFQCHICFKVYTNDYVVKRHLRGVHKLSTVQCRFCSETFNSADALNTHIQCHTDGKGQVKMETFLTSKNSANGDIPPVRAHSKSPKASITTAADKLAEDDSNSSPNEERPRDELIDDSTFKCELCQKEFNDPGLLRIHVSKHQIFSCNKCSLTFKTSDHLTSHKQGHKKKTMELAKKRKACEDHINRHTRERPHACTICDKVFTWKVTLKKHMLTHVHSIYNCARCGLSFPKKVELNDHILVHKLTDLTCNDCGKVFETEDGLGAHACSAFDEPDFKCNDCGEAFEGEDALVTHVCKASLEDKQTTENDYKCKKCKEMFQCKDALIAHTCQTTPRIRDVEPTSKEIIPMNEPVSEGSTANFLCYECGKTFQSEDILCEHTCQRLTGTTRLSEHVMESDTVDALNGHDESSYRCDVCQIMFSGKESLVEHMVLHIGEIGNVM